MTQEQLQNLLDAEFKPEIGKMTIRAYFKELLQTLWKEESIFSGKRPFGNGGWQNDMYGFFLRKGLISGELDDNGGILDINESEGETLAIVLIQAM